MFFTYNQNNSGGSYAIDDTITRTVVIEADTADEANTKAEELGIYFNGVAEGSDCACCGDRWSKAYDDDGVLRMDLGEYELNSYWVEKDEPIVYIYRKNGTKLILSEAKKSV
jgi:hypothetical protein